MVSAGEFISDHAGAVQSGDAAKLLSQPVEFYLKNHSGSGIQGAADIANTLNSGRGSDSVGSSVMDISAVLAVNEAKKRFMRIFKNGESPEEKSRVEHRKSKKYHYVEGDERVNRPHCQDTKRKYYRDGINFVDMPK